MKIRWRKEFLCVLVMIRTGLSTPLTLRYAASHDDHREPTDYSFSYGVNDPHTGDIKHQWEKKHGDTVTGHYSVVEPDGSIRTVEYSADDKTGFNAVVKHTGPSQHVFSKHATSHKEVVLKPSENHEPTPQYLSGEQYQYSFPENPEEVQNEYVKEEEEEEENEKQNYYYQEESGEESQKSSIKSKYPNYVKNQGTEYSKKAIHLPVDLNVIKQNPLETIVPLEVSVVRPDDIVVQQKSVPQHHSTPAPKVEAPSEYSPQIDVSIQPSRELSQEEVNRFIETYYRKNNKLISQPQIEHGFKPIIRKPSEPVSQASVPQTYKSHKQPISTPGLSSYTSKYYKIRNKHRIRGPRTHLTRRHLHQYPVSEETREERHKADISRLYRSLPADGYVRYAKHVSIQEI